MHLENGWVLEMIASNYGYGDYDPDEEEEDELEYGEQRYDEEGNLLLPF